MHKIDWRRVLTWNLVSFKPDTFVFIHVCFYLHYQLYIVEEVYNLLIWYSYAWPFAFYNKNGLSFPFRISLGWKQMCPVWMIPNFKLRHAFNRCYASLPLLRWRFLLPMKAVIKNTFARSDKADWEKSFFRNYIKKKLFDKMYCARYL